jgi:hypothetical protein
VALLAAGSVVTVLGDGGNAAVRFAIVVVGLAVLVAAFRFSAKQPEAEFGGEPEPAEKVKAVA